MLSAEERRRQRKRRRRLFTGRLTRLSGRVEVAQREEVSLAEVEERGGESLLLALRGDLASLLPGLRIGGTYEFHDFSRRVMLHDDHGFRREALCAAKEDVSCIRETEPAESPIAPLPENALVAELESPASVLTRDLLLATPFILTGTLENICQSGWIELTQVMAQAAFFASGARLDRCKIFFPHYYPTNLSASFKVVSIHNVLPMYLWERKLEGFYSTISSAICQQGPSDSKSTEAVMLRVPSSVSQRCAMFSAWYFRSASVLASCFHPKPSRDSNFDTDLLVMRIFSIFDDGKSSLFDKHSFLAEFSDVHYTELFQGDFQLGLIAFYHRIMG